VVLILGRVGFASYELPVGYLGAAHEDLAALSEAEVTIARLAKRRRPQIAC
jgi:hypothetical protein